MPTWTSLLLVALVSGAAPAAAQHQDWEQAEDEPRPDPEPGARTPALAELDAEEEAHDDEEGEGAQDQDGDEDGDEDEGFDVGDTAAGGTFVGWAELGLFVGSFDFNQLLVFDVGAISPLIGGSYSVSDRIRINLEAGLALAIHSSWTDMTAVEQDGGAAFEFANPLLSADYSGGEDLRWRLGLGVTIPLANAGSDLASQAALQLAAAVRGLWNIWLWASQRLTPVLEGRIETDLGESLVVGADGGLGILLFIGDSISQETLIIGQAATDIEWHPSDRVAVGGRLMAVLGDDLGERDATQFSFMPYARLGLSETTFITAGLVLNIDPPMGFGFSSGNVWGLRVGIGSVLASPDPVAVEDAAAE